MTGIDRVELAYMQHLLMRPEPLFGLVRTALGFVLLDRAGMWGVADRAVGQVPLGRADVLGLLTQRHLPQRVRAEADARRLSMARCLPHRLGALLRRALPGGTAYINVGHANLSARVVQAVRSRPGWRIVVMLHDTIPLDHPQFCDARVTRAFAEKLRLVSTYADQVIHSAKCTRQQTEGHLARAGRIPSGVTAPLGVVLATPDARTLGQIKDPYYVALGTIEPRKNISLLVDIWTCLQEGPDPVPHLYIVGHRGWADPALFQALDALVATGAVTMRHDLGDAAVSALLHGAQALLFPSFAEGYGLPPIEAAALGIPVLTGKLPVVVERLGDYPVYLDTSDVYTWAKTINQQMKHRTQGRDAGRHYRIPPTWADHFDQVFGKA